MLFLLTCFFYASGVMATYDTSKPAVNIKNKPVMCEYGREYASAECVPVIEIEDFPCECEIIAFQPFVINNLSVITTETEVLKKVTNFRPTIIVVSRENNFCDWYSILKSPDSIKKDTDVLCKFAKTYNVVGYKLVNIFPEEDSDTYSPEVPENLPQYLKQLKCNDKFIVGISVPPEGPLLKNPCVAPFATFNEVVDFYEIFTYGINVCEPELYNGCTPIKEVEHGNNYQLGMVEVTSNLKTTAADLTKIYYALEISPVDSLGKYLFYSYYQVCRLTKFKTWCIQSTQDLYDKGAYIKKESAGMNFRYVELDDSLNTCECTSPFIGFKNAMAGYTGGSHMPCKKFDVQSGHA